MQPVLGNPLTSAKGIIPQTTATAKREWQEKTTAATRQSGKFLSYLRFIGGFCSLCLPKYDETASVKPNASILCYRLNTMLFAWIVKISGASIRPVHTCSLARHVMHGSKAQGSSPTN